MRARFLPLTSVPAGFGGEVGRYDVPGQREQQGECVFGHCGVENTGSITDEKTRVAAEINRHRLIADPESLHQCSGAQCGVEIAGISARAGHDGGGPRLTL
jgi:hypothetical protein